MHSPVCIPFSGKYLILIIDYIIINIKKYNIITEAVAV